MNKINLKDLKFQKINLLSLKLKWNTSINLGNSV